MGLDLDWAVLKYPAMTTSLIFFSLPFSLDDRGYTLSATDAGSRQSVAATLQFQDSGQRAHQTNPRGPQRMSDGQASAHYVDPLRVDSQLLDAIKGTMAKASLISQKSMSFTCKPAFANAF